MKKSPRIYTYKVTFEEIPHWYWGVHKEKKFGEIYSGSPKTHKWMWEFYTPQVQILEFFPYTDEGWVEAQDVENRCIKPDLNNLLCLNEHYGSVISMEVLRQGSKKPHEEKDEFGRSALGVKNAARMLEEKDHLGRSVNPMKAHEEKDELGRSVHGVKCAEKLHEEKDELGRSVNAVKAGTSTNKEKDELGRSIHGVKSAEKVHKEKDYLGRSIHALKAFERVHDEKDELGRSIHAMTVGKKGGETSSAQRWVDPQHPELGEHPPGPLALMQKSRGYPHGKENRVRVK